MIIAETSQKQTVILETNELYFLSELFGAGASTEGDNPILTYYAQGEMNEDWEKARESLLAKGILRKAGGGVELEERAFSGLAPLLFADKACWMKYKTGTGIYEESLLVTDEKVMAMELWQGEPALHRVDEIGGVKEACGILADKLKWNRRTPEEIPALLLSKRQFEDIHSRADELDMEEIMEELSKISDDQEGIIALAKCMKTSVSQGDLRLFARHGMKWECQSAQFMNNHHLNWLIRASSREDEDWLIATPTPQEKFHEMLQHWFQQ
ncbi:hypothetical protein V3851_09545 [Paenibacillus sp. M1]|uniref:Uncharacterized protein n=1 Tax=Paenibacillus haidiansis TaxID=1574488 RepID=A0ABU7VRG4_9BACL